MRDSLGVRLDGERAAAQKLSIETYEDLLPLCREHQTFRPRLAGEGLNPDAPSRLVVDVEPLEFDLGAGFLVGGMAGWPAGPVLSVSSSGGAALVGGQLWVGGPMSAVTSF